MSDWKKLRELAEAATPGPWRTTDGYDGSQSGRYDDCVSILESASGESVIEHVYYDGHHTIMQPRDARFIAAANPTTILALLDENDSLRFQLAEEQRLGTARLQAQLDIGRERDKLRAEVERLRMQHGIACGATEAMTGAFERSQQQLAAALAAKEEACDAAIAFRDGLPVTVSIATLRSIGKDGGNG